MSGTEASRRTVLRTAGLVGIGTVAASTKASAANAASADRTASWRPDPDSPRFTLAVMPDTQYLFDADRIHPEPLVASFDYILRTAADRNIAFLAHLGDLTENGQQAEFDRVSPVFATLDRRGVAYSVLAGNHDVGGSTNDQRGPTPYLKTFGPGRFARSASFAGATPDGYNTYHRFQAGGRDWLLLALDWRPTATSIAWARDVIRKHPRTPVILTTHEIVYSGDDGKAQFSDFGQRLWDDLIRDNDQIFLTLNGHFWPPGRTTLTNTAGNDVHLHITNYQNRYYGGAAMIRLYHFDLSRDTIDVETLSPWILGQPERARNRLEREEAELTSDADRFSVPVDFARRFAGFDPQPARPARPARQLLIPGTVAYWRFDTQLTDRVPDQSGHGNDLVRKAVDGSPADALTWSADHHPDQPAHGSLRLVAGKDETGLSLPGAWTSGRRSAKRLYGAYLETVPSAPLNAATLSRGYTVEAFFKLPTDWDAGRNAWAGLLSRWGLAGEAGKPEGDPQEPVATLSISDGHGLQWALYPLNQRGVITNWSHELPLGEWWHVAVVNDGRHSVMYVDGCPVVRNPATPAVGITTLGRPWMVGGYEYGGKLDQVYNGWLGDLRIVDRPLSPAHFMTA
jgi:hypothetical protein